MEVDAPPTDVKSELPTPPASDVGSPSSFSHSGSDSEPDSPMGEETKVTLAPDVADMTAPWRRHSRIQLCFVKWQSSRYISTLRVNYA